MRALVLLAALLVGCAPRRAAEAPALLEESAPSSTEAPPPAVAATVPLHWVGEWKSGAEGVKFGFDIRLTGTANALSGRILWTLLSVPPGHFLTPRVNDAAQEFVTGTWNEGTRELHLKGNSVDDDTLLATDEYKLIVSADSATFDGRTRGNKGDWANEISGRRAED